MATGGIVVYFPKVTLDIIHCLRYGIVYVHDVKESASVLRKRIIRSDGPNRPGFVLHLSNDGSSASFRKPCVHQVCLMWSSPYNRPRKPRGGLDV